MTFICRVIFMIMVGVRGAKRIFVLDTGHCCYEIEKILTSADMIITDIDK